MTIIKISINFASQTIGAGSNAKLYELHVPRGHVAFITDFANTLQNSDCYMKWDIDGEPVTEANINYVIGAIDKPKKYAPPLVVKKKMIVYGYNDGATEEIFEVLADGYMLKEEDYVCGIHEPGT